MIRWSTILALLVVAAPIGTRADPWQPSFDLELQIDARAEANTAGDARNAFPLESELSLSIDLSYGLALQAVTTLEAARPRERSAWLGEEDVILETLVLELDQEQWQLRAGRFTPGFGRAWEEAPGVFGADFAEDYELSERIGLGGTLRFAPERLGRHTLDVDAFFVDTSALSGSLFGRRPPTRRSDGGAGNTGVPNSFVAGLSGSALPGLEGLRYHAAWLEQAGDPSRGHGERGFALSVGYRAPIGRLHIDAIAERVRRRSSERGSREEDYWTAGLELESGRWRSTVGFSQRRHRSRNRLLSMSVGREIGSGFAITLAWRSQHGSDEQSEVLALQWTWEGRIRNPGKPNSR